MSQESLMGALGCGTDSGNKDDSNSDAPAGRVCTFVGVGNFPNQKSSNGRSCQVCRWEQKGLIKTKSVVYCQSHKIRACSEKWDYRNSKAKGSGDWNKKIAQSDKNDLKWLCQNTEWTCWEKAHRFYIPKGLWGKDRSKVYGTNSIWSLQNGKKPVTLSVSTSSEIFQQRDTWMVDHGFKANRKRSPGRQTKNSPKRTTKTTSSKSAEPKKVIEPTILSRRYEDDDEDEDNDSDTAEI